MNVLRKLVGLSRLIMQYPSGALIGKVVSDVAGALIGRVLSDVGGIGTMGVGEVVSGFFWLTYGCRQLYFAGFPFTNLCSYLERELVRKPHLC